MSVKLLTALTVAAIAGGVYAILPGLAATGPATIRITDRQTLDRQFGHGQGAREISRASLYSRGKRPRRIGHEVMVCTFVDHAERSCTVTVVLPKGTIVTAGILQSRLLYQLAIVGGTGFYDNARGTLTATLIGLRPRRDLLLFRLTG